MLAALTSLTALGMTPQARAIRVPRALIRLAARAQQRLWGLRLGRVYGFGIGVSYALVLLWGPESLPLATKLWARALGVATWVAGVGALSLSADLERGDAAQGLTSMARLRGFNERQLEVSRVAAGALRLATTVATPGLIVALATAGRFRTLAGAGTALGCAVLGVLYAALVGGSLAPLARACHHWLPGRGRFLLLSLTLGPWLLGLGLGAALPSVPGAYGWLLEHLSRSVR
jgi:hypothetical protein